MVIEFQRWPNLGNTAIFQHGLTGIQQHDLIRQRHGFDLIMRDIDHAGTQIMMQLGNLDAGLYAQRRIQIGQRLIKQENARFAHNSPADSHALTLPTGQFLRQALQQMLDLQDLCRPAHTLIDFVVALLFGKLQAKCHVVENRHMRV